MPGRAGEWAVRRSWPFAVAKEALLFSGELGLSSQVPGSLIPKG